MQAARFTRVLLSFGALMLSSAALATNFECGTVACNVFESQQPVTAIDDLVIDGDHFDVTFSNSPTSLLEFSFDTSKAGQPLTGVDAANALDAFYGTQQGPYPGADGPGIPALVDGVLTGVYNIATAYEPAPSPNGGFLVDAVQPFLGLSGPPVQVAPFAGDSTPTAGSVVVTNWNSPCGVGACAVFTPIAPPAAAPEISPTGAPVALTLLLGMVAMLQSRRRSLRRTV